MCYTGVAANDVTIVFYTKTMADFYEPDSALDGYQIYSMRQLLLHVVAHEMVHVIQDMLMYNPMYQDFAKKKQYHDGIFASMVRNIFGHPMGATSSTWQNSHPKLNNLEAIYQNASCDYRMFHNRL